MEEGVSAKAWRSALAKLRLTTAGKGEALNAETPEAISSACFGQIAAPLPYLSMSTQSVST